MTCAPKFAKALVTNRIALVYNLWHVLQSLLRLWWPIEYHLSILAGSAGIQHWSGDFNQRSGRSFQWLDVSCVSFICFSMCMPLCPHPHHAPSATLLPKSNWFFFRLFYTNIETDLLKSLCSPCCESIVWKRLLSSLYHRLLGICSHQFDVVSLKPLFVI